jgi:UDP-N-acetylmuramyl pentapeptide phosphotransferase/UDP-N-acetylglucosamine-1-phosphate transferase
MSVWVFTFVFIISYFLHFVVQKIFIYYRRFDDYNHRSSHNTLATRTGGIGVFITLLCISIFFYIEKVELFDYSLFIPLGIMFIVGVYDDFYRADFKLKFLLQIIVAKILIDQGYVISNYYGLFGLYEVPWLLAQISTVFVFLVIVNAINFIDGIDGLAISEVIKTILIIEFLSLGYTKLSSMGFIVIFSLLPLYYFNFKRKSKVFLGDGGSLLLGSIIAIYIFYLLGEEFIFDSKWVLNKTLFSILVIIYPLSDLLRVFIIRAKNGVSPFKPDKNHIHHLLNSKTKSHIIATSVIIFVQLLIFFTYYSFD